MPRRRSSRRAVQHTARSHHDVFEDTALAESPPSQKCNRCIVCKDQLTLFKVKHRRAYAHPLCAWFDRMGMEELAKTSGRWF